MAEDSKIEVGEFGPRPARLGIFIDSAKVAVANLARTTECMVNDAQRPLRDIEATLASSYYGVDDHGGMTVHQRVKMALDDLARVRKERDALAEKLGRLEMSAKKPQASDAQEALMADLLEALRKNRMGFRLAVVMELREHWEAPIKALEQKVNALAAALKVQW